MDISFWPNRVPSQFVVTTLCIESEGPSPILFFTSYIFLDRTQIVFDFLLLNLTTLRRTFV